MGSRKILCMFLCFYLFLDFPGALSYGGLFGKWQSKTSLNLEGQAVQLEIEDKYVVMNNGIVQVRLSKPDGIITEINYNGIDNLLETLNDETNRGYWDMVWSDDTTTLNEGNFNRICGMKFEVIEKTDEQIELSFSTSWDPSLHGKAVPLNIDLRFIMLRGSSGFYTYAIYEHLKEWPAFVLDNTRIAFKLSKEKFHYMAIANDRQRNMPSPDDRIPPRGQPLAYPEAVLLVNPIEAPLRGEVDDKYQYSSDQKDIYVHGWIAPDGEAPVGFWQITPSNEFRSGGPLKQSLTSHVGPTSLTVLHSTHYAGRDMVMHFGQNEPWKKVFGPFFIYLNSLSNGGNPISLWEDAKNQAEQEVRSWPYEFPASEDFPKANQRGSVSGRLLVLDRDFSSRNNLAAADDAYVGLALPGEVGSWQVESKGYQFWTRTDRNGMFTINNIRTGAYNLYAWIPGYIGDYKADSAITIIPGRNINVGDLVYEPPRSGPTLWEIGVPDRTAAEFYIPDANPTYVNKLYVDHDKFRQYGLWERYAELYPNQDLVYTVGNSNYSKDWFFVQPTRKNGNAYIGTTWEIKFNLPTIDRTGTYTLWMALATATVAQLQVRVNDPKANPPLCTTGRFGWDNAIARHGIHGLYRLFSALVPGSKLVEGENSIFLSQVESVSPFQGIMYDYIRFEGPPPSTNPFN